MSILCDWQIEQYCYVAQSPLIDPYDSALLQPSSYDAKLASSVLVPHGRNSTPIDTRLPADDRYDEMDISDGFMLTPFSFVLGATLEWVNIPSTMVGRIEGKSSRARQGIQIHSAGYIDPGFCGNVTLEVVNFSPHPIVLYPDVLIAQFSFEWLSQTARQPYSSDRNHYQNSKGAIGSRANQ